MHSINIPDTILDRVARFRAQRHMFTDLDPRRTAHVVVDLQNGFMEPGAPVEVPTAREIVPNVNRITKAVRDAGGAIVYLRFMTDAGALASWTAFYDAMFNRGRRDEMQAAATIQNRRMIFVSDHALSSKWWWIGAIRNTRLRNV